MSPRNEGQQSSIPEHAERIDAGGSDNGAVDNGIGDTLSAEDQANLDAMQRGEPMPAPGDQGAQDQGQGDQGGDAGDGEGDDDADGEGDQGGDGQGQQQPGAKDGQKPGDQPRPKDGQQAKPGDAQGQQQEKPKGKTVNRDKYERETLKLQTRAETAEAALRSAELNQAKLGERMSLLQEAIQTLNKGGGQQQPGADGQQQQRPAAQQNGGLPTREADPEPDPEADPFGHGQWTRRELARTQQEFANLAKRIDERESQQDRAALQNDVVASYTREMQQAFAADPTNQQAYEFMRNSRHQELGFTFAGIDIFDDVDVAKLTPAQQGALAKKIDDTFHSEELWLADQARQGGPNVPTRIMQLAKSRGFKPQAAQQQRNPQDQGDGGDDQGQQQNRNGNGQQRQPVARGNQQSDGQRRMQNLRDNIEDSRSLSDGHSVGDSANMMERLASMGDDEFAEAIADMSPQKLNRMLGMGQ